MKTLPFNLEAALRGEPVVTRDGRPVTDLADTDDDFAMYIVNACLYDETTEYSFTRAGEWSEEYTTKHDLFMLDTSVKTVDPRRGEWAARFTAIRLTEGYSHRDAVCSGIESADGSVRQLDA